VIIRDDFAKADPCRAVNSAATPPSQGEPGHQRLPRTIGRAELQARGVLYSMMPSQ